MTGLPERIVRAVERSGLTGEWVTRQDLDSLPPIAGAYALVLRLDRPLSLERPKRETLVPGDYLYAGSARGPGGLRSRVTRHFRADKPLHWHVDHLTVAAMLPAAFLIPGGSECDLAARLSHLHGFDFAVAGFGSSDCRRCASHLLTAMGQDRRSTK